MAQVSFAIRDDHIGTELDSESGLQKQTLNLSVTSGSNRSFSLQKLGQSHAKSFYRIGQVILGVRTVESE